MNIETFRSYCLGKKAVTESFPFDDNVLVFKVLDKMFALTNIKGEFSINLKCDPEKAIQLREKYLEVEPGYHMSKKHWNIITPKEGFSDPLLKTWIDDSYNLVISKMTKKKQKILAET